MSTRSSWLRICEDIAEQYGVDLEPTRNGHLRFRHPDTGRVIATTSSTPRNEWRTRKNTEATIRRAIRHTDHHTETR